jgi:hypothetical protein
MQEIRRRDQPHEEEMDFSMPDTIVDKENENVD